MGYAPIAGKRSSLLRHASLSRQWLNSGKSSVKGFLIDFDEFRFDCLGNNSLPINVGHADCLDECPQEDNIGALWIAQISSNLCGIKRHSRHFPGKAFNNMFRIGGSLTPASEKKCHEAIKMAYFFCQIL